MDARTTNLKMAIIGSPQSGKTMFIHNLLTPSLISCQTLSVYNPTPSYEMSLLKFVHLNVSYEIQMWDCGSEHANYHKHMKKAFFKNSSAAILVFSILNEKWKEEVAMWISEAYQNDCYLVYAIASKTDLLNDFCKSPATQATLKNSLLQSDRKSFLDSYSYELNFFFDDYQIKHYFQNASQKPSFHIKSLFLNIHDDHMKRSRVSLARGIKMDNSLLDDYWIKMDKEEEESNSNKKSSYPSVKESIMQSLKRNMLDQFSRESH